MIHPTFRIVSTDARTSATRVHLERWLVASFVAILLAGTLGRVIRRPLWHDELFTHYVATRTQAEGLWNALLTGVDLNPPLYYIAVRASGAVIGPGAVATRLPSMIGFLTAAVALYVFMRRRVSFRFALAAALTLPLSGGLMYAWEGRPYGMVLGLSSIALAAWQRRGENGPHPIAPIACSMALAAAVFTHYYAVLMTLPLAAGEATRVVIRRRVDWPMWIALALAICVPLVLLWPLVHGARQFAPTFWSSPTLDKLAIFGRELMDPLALVLIIATGCMALAEAVWPQRQTHTSLTPVAPAGYAGLRADEVAAALMLTALPLAGYLLALYTGAFHGRYVLQVVLGLGILVGWGSAALIKTRRNAAIFLAVLLLAFTGRLASTAFGLVRGPADPLADHELFLSLPRNGSPIVVSRVLDYLPIAHYSGSNSGARVVFLTKPPEPRLGLLSRDRAIRLLAHYAPLEVVDFNQFVASQNRFYVYGHPGWMIPALVARGATIRFLGEHDNATLYEIEGAR